MVQFNHRMMALCDLRACDLARHRRRANGEERGGRDVGAGAGVRRDAAGRPRHCDAPARNAAAARARASGDGRDCARDCGDARLPARASGDGTGSGPAGRDDDRVRCFGDGGGSLSLARGGRQPASAGLGRGAQCRDAECALRRAVRAGSCRHCSTFSTRPIGSRGSRSAAAMSTISGRTRSIPRGSGGARRSRDYRGDDPEWDVLLDVDALAKSRRRELGLARLRLASSRASARARSTVARRRRRHGQPRIRSHRPGALSTTASSIPETKFGAAWIDADTLLVSATLGGEDYATTSGYPRTVRTLAARNAVRGGAWACSNANRRTCSSGAGANTARRNSARSSSSAPISSTASSMSKTPTDRCGRSISRATPISTPMKSGSSSTCAAIGRWAGGAIRPVRCW